MLKNLLGQLFRPGRAAARGAVPLEERLRAALGHQQSGRLAEAETIYRELLDAVPPHADVMHLLASNLMLQRRHHEAVALLERVTALQPQSAEACYNLGGALNALGQYERAAQCFEKALDLRPDFAEALSSLGNVLTAAGRLDEAEISYRRALGLRPDSAEAVYNLGNLLHLEGRLAEAIECYRRAFMLRPSFVTAHSNYVYALNFDPGYEPQRVFEEHLAWARSHAEPLRSFIPHHANEAVPGRRLRVGYVSPNFRNHAAAYFFEPVLACHDARQFQIFCYSDVLQADEYTARLRQCSGEWRECAHLTDAELAEQILGDRIDILVDLTWHTAGNRLLAFARKPAPIQVTYLAYPNTTGMNAVDYRLTDAICDPPGATERYYRETLIRLPRCMWCYQPHADMPAVSPYPARQHGSVTFASMNGASKVTTRMLALWGRILCEVPGSRIVFATVPEQGHARIRDALIIGAIHKSTACLEQFIFGIQQIEQGTLADIELLTVSITRFFRSQLMCIEITQLLRNTPRIVIGNG